MTDARCAVNAYALEELGYLDPGRRGNRADERDAIAMFLVDVLSRSK
jgi:hypothetical protein